MKIIEIIKNAYNAGSISTTIIASVLLMVSVLSVYEFLVYKFVSKKSLYNSSFNIAIVVIPYFIATIILCLQSNIVITLGTIGALAIIRFRTAIKDPTDMVYLLWSVHTGIMMGCQLYEVSILTSIVATIMIIIFTSVKSLFKEYVLAIRTTDDEKTVIDSIKNEAKNIKLEAKNFVNNESGKSNNYIFILRTKNIKSIQDKLENNNNIQKYSLTERNGENL